MRLRVLFWLNSEREIDLQLKQYIEDLKSKRKFVKTVRDGLLLIKTLRDGDTSVLYRMFPLLQQQNASPQLMTTTRTVLEPNKDAYDTIEVHAASADEDIKPTWNFLIDSALATVGHCKTLPLEIQEYAVKKGKIASVYTSEPKGPKKMDVPKLETPTIELDFDLVET